MDIIANHAHYIMKINKAFTGYKARNKTNLYDIMQNLKIPVCGEP